MDQPQAHGDQPPSHGEQPRSHPGPHRNDREQPLIRRLAGAGPALGGLDLLRDLGEEPGVRANMVSSADGHATIRGRVGDLTGAADQALLVALRGWCDVLLVGSGTIRAEGYGLIDLPAGAREWRVSRGRTAHPVLAILSGSLDLDPTLPAFADAAGRGPDALPWVITGPGADPARRARLAAYARFLEVPAAPDGRPSLPAAIAALGTAGMTRVLSEGGPAVLGGLIGAGLVDELFITVSPLLVGGEGPRIVGAPAYDAAVPLRLVEVLGAGGELFLRYGVGAEHGAVVRA